MLTKNQEKGTSNNGTAAAYEEIIDPLKKDLNHSILCLRDDGTTKSLKQKTIDELNLKMQTSINELLNMSTALVAGTNGCFLKQGTSLCNKLNTRAHNNSIKNRFSDI